MPDLKTLGQIAREAGVSFAQAKYAADESGVEPAMRAGIIRLFDTDQVSLIRSTLARIAHNRADRHISTD